MFDVRHYGDACAVERRAEEHAAVAVRLLLELQRQLEVAVGLFGGQVAVFGVGSTLADQLAVFDVPQLGPVHRPSGEEFLHEVPEFEKMLINSDIKILKFYFSVSKTEQKRRFDKRRTDPLKQYKLSPVDEKSQDMWDQYTIAKYSMLLASHTEHAPWTVIRSDNKKKARINCIKHILCKLNYPNKVKAKKLSVDEKVRIHGSDEIRIMETEMTLKKLT